MDHFVTCASDGRWSGFYIGADGNWHLTESQCIVGDRRFITAYIRVKIQLIRRTA